MTEPAHSAIFNRRVVGGEIMIVNKYLINDFEKIGIWSEDLEKRNHSSTKDQFKTLTSIII
jgi:hypothetical protein